MSDSKLQVLSARQRSNEGQHPEPEKLEVLDALSGRVHEFMERHKSRRRLWFPGELLPAGPAMTGADEDRLHELRARARELPIGVRVSLVLNQLTEEGLPHFHRLIATHLPQRSAWSEWNFLWTAEEDRHGCILRDYMRDSRVVDSLEVDILQHDYLADGFDPDWNRDPYRLLAYTSLQERATQVAHAGTGRKAREYEPLIGDILSAVAGDEARHFVFYRDVFGELLDLDINRALAALLKVAPALTMPGTRIPGFDAMARVVARAGIYGPRDYRRIVKQLLEHWRIGERTGLSGEGARAQDKLMALPARLQRLIERQTERVEAALETRFGFLPDAVPAD